LREQANISLGSFIRPPLKDIAQTWADEIADHTNRDLARNVIEPNNMNRVVIAEAIFAQFASNLIVGFKASILHRDVKGKRVYYGCIEPLLFSSDPVTIGRMGETKIVDEIIANRSTQGKRWMGSIKGDFGKLSPNEQTSPLVKRFAELTIDNLPPDERINVARPIDIVEIDRNGIRWTANEQHCPED